MTHCHNWLHNAEEKNLICELDILVFIFWSAVYYYSTLTWRTGCASVYPGTQRSDRVRFRMVPIGGGRRHHHRRRRCRCSASAFCILLNMCFHLGLRCQYASSAQALFLPEQWQGQTVKIENVCFVSLLGSGFATHGEKSQSLSGVVLAQLGSGNTQRSLASLVS